MFLFWTEWSSSSSHMGSGFSCVQSVTTLVRFPFLQKTHSQLQGHIQVTKSGAKMQLCLDSCRQDEHQSSTRRNQAREQTLSSLAELPKGLGLAELAF